ncbi:MAG TPA: hypothetical protein VLA93_04300 [Pyrinomonadaceae bacterium]|nr:hypothetical protein [Pyrinomonadaceae bacterium]
MKRLLRSSLCLIVCFFLLGPSISFACGPFALDTIFVFTVHPAHPLENFARGDLGVVQPSYARSYLVVAYRHLSAVGFSREEQQELIDLWKDRLDYGRQLEYDEWIKNWLTARQKVPGLTQAKEIDVYRNREEPNQYETFLNCQKDAFDNAVATLNARMAKYGVESAAIKSWVEAQDQVFSNCHEGKQMPTPVAADADSTLRSDRTYQIAAANFYATNFDEAVAAFDSIANENGSPWQLQAPYLAARSLVRKASLATPENKTKPLSEAEQRLTSILGNRKLSNSHHASSRLLNLVRLRLRPAERLQELAKKLVTRNNSSLKQDLWDYTVLLDGFLEASDAEKAKFSADARADDLTDWLVTMQSSSTDARNHSLERWRSNHSKPWLVAALSKAQGADVQSAELISAALEIEQNSAAFPSARFHAARLLVESGKKDDARRTLDELLNSKAPKFDESTRNLLLSLRMRVATDLADYVKFAPRKPAAVSWNDDGRELPAELSRDTETIQPWEFFDVDSTRGFNKHLPLSVLKAAVKSSDLPLHLRSDLVQATWLRAVLLNDLKTADELTPLMKKYFSVATVYLENFESAQQPEAKRFAAIFMWLRTPGLEPSVDQGLGRQKPVGEQDTYRDNWWCSAAYPGVAAEPEDEGTLPSFTAEDEHAPGFLTTAERAAAAREHAVLNGFGAAPNYIARQVIQWANTNPADPRVPEALHLAVNSTRYGCTDKNTGRWSKAAFDLLHRRYGNSVWAKKTRYWFKD